jgi:O-antigen ligase/tetratricopeptide (TPR) repeat protein
MEMTRTIIVIHLVLSPLVFSRYTLEAFEYNKVALLVLTALVLTASGLTCVVNQAFRLPPGHRLGILWSSVRDFIAEPIALGFSLYGASAVISTVASVSPRTSLLGTYESYAGLGTVAGYLVLFMATRALFQSPADQRYLLAAAVVSSAIASAYGLVQAIGMDPLSWERLSAFADHLRPFSTLGHPNFLAAYLVMATPVLALFAYGAARAGRPFLGLALTVFGLMALAVVLLSLSRGAWLALGIVALFGLACWWRSSRDWRLMLLVGALATAVFLGLWWFGQASGGGFWKSLVKRVQTLPEAASRTEIWRAALGLFKAHPLVGCGLDTFQIAFGSKRTAAYWRIEWDLTPAKAHNEAIHILATQGVLGGTALVILTAGLIGAGARAWRKASGDHRPILLAACAGIIGFYVQNLFSFTVAGCGTLFVTFAALLSARTSGPANKGESPAPTTGKWFAGSLGVGTLISLVIFFGNVVANSEPRPQSLQACCLTVALAGGLALYSVLVLEAGRRTATPAASGSGCRAFSSPTRHQPQSGERGARSAWPFALRAPRSALPGHRLIAALVGASSLVIAFLYVLGPYRADMACCRGEQLLSEDADRAMRDYERAVALAPSYEIYWVKLAAGAQSAAHQQKGTVPLRRRLLQARQALERAVQLVPANPANHANFGRVLAELARQGWADPNEAFGELERAIAADPNNASFLATAGHTALTFGQPERARQYFARGLKIDPDNGSLSSGLGGVALAERHLPEALAHLLESLGHDWHGDDDARLHGLVLLGAVHLQLNQPEQAQRATQRVLQQRPHWPEPRFLLARSFEVQGMREAAVVEYRKVQAEFPGHVPSRDALARLQR